MTKDLLLKDDNTPYSPRSATYDYAAHADAPNTQRSYAADWKHFMSWCRQRNTSPLPANPDDVALYARTCVTKLKLKISTLQRRMAAIGQAHLRNGYDSPTQEWVVSKTMMRLRRESGTPPRGKDPLLTEDIKDIVSLLPHSLTGKRDKAILLLGFAGGMRRSEVVALNVDDLKLAEEGLIVKINRGKTDQFGAGRKIGIPYGKDPLACPVRGIIEWVEAAKIESGPLFRGVNRFGRVSNERLTSQVVYLIVKEWSKKAGKNPAAYGAHSLRVGLVTAATIGGASEREIQNQTGHKSLLTLRRYIRDADVFRENAVKKTGL